MNVKKVLLIFLGIVLILVLGVWFILTHPPAELKNTNSNALGEESHGNRAISKENSDAAAEKTFLEEMIPHHAEAVMSSKIALEKSQNPEVRQLAQNIVTGQEKEIADMKGWYKAWYKEDYKDLGTYHTMTTDLTSLSGKSFDKAFLEGMIEHHLHALTMGQTVAPVITHDEIRTLAENIATTQSDEIITMRILLKAM